MAWVLPTAILMVLADIVARRAAESTPKVLESSRKPDFKTLDLAAEEKGAAAIHRDIHGRQEGLLHQWRKIRA
jgi:hypothetical protein